MEPPTSVREAPTPLVEPAEETADRELSALRRDDVFRLRNFAQWVVVLCAISLFVQHLNGGTSAMRELMRGALVALGGTAAWMWWSTRGTPDHDALRPKVRIFGIVAVATSFVFELRIGVFSPVTAVLVFGLAFFARSEGRRAIWTLGMIAIGAYVVLATLIALDVLVDPGVYSAPSLPRSVKLVTILTTTSVFFATLVHARMSRRSSEEMLRIARNAKLLARRREAQLDEANGDLLRVLRATIGREGRHTGAVAGHWTLGEVVGRGAMGEVYAGIDRRSGLRVAVKVLHATRGAEEDLRRRFLREARIAASLRSPHLAEVHGIGETMDGTPFIAMELLEGRDLACILRRSTRLPLHDAVNLVRQVAFGLAAAHDAGVIHRDLKPQNLFYADHRGVLRWKVLDFGISTLVDSNGTLTADDIIGTPGYMAPEQANGERVDLRTDLFALGAVVYRALTGQPAFPGSAAPQILYSVVFENAIHPRALEPTLTPDVEAFLAIALAKAPNDRFASAGEMADALERASRGELDPKLRARAAEILARHPWRYPGGTPFISPRERTCRA